ncbi:hypothetical protein JCM11641_001674 [Rhodosporidiobolus odoratus]
MTPPPRRQLPYDIIRLIAHVARDSFGEDDVRQVARSFALVCRELKDVGQAMLWSRLDLPHRWAEEEAQTEAKRRILGMVRILRVEGRVPERCDLLDRTAKTISTLAPMLSAVKTLELAEVPSVGVVSDILVAMSASPSAGNITDVALAGELQTLDTGASELGETGLLRALQAFPSLSSLSLKVFPRVPSAHQTALGTRQLSLRNLAFRDPMEDCPSSTSPYWPISSAINPSTLVSLSVSRMPGLDGWIEWLDRPTFTSLRRLHVNSQHEPIVNFLPRLSTCLSRHRALASLAVYTDLDLGGHLGLDWADAHDLEIFRAFLFALPETHQILFLGLEWNDKTEMYEETSIYVPPYFWQAPAVIGRPFHP